MQTVQTMTCAVHVTMETNISCDTDSIGLMVPVQKGTVHSLDV